MAFVLCLRPDSTARGCTRGVTHKFKRTTELLSAALYDCSDGNRKAPKCAGHLAVLRANRRRRRVGGTQGVGGTRCECTPTQNSRTHEVPDLWYPMESRGRLTHASVLRRYLAGLHKWLSLSPGRGPAVLAPLHHTRTQTRSYNLLLVVVLLLPLRLLLR